MEAQHQELIDAMAERARIEVMGAAHYPREDPNDGAASGHHDQGGQAASVVDAHPRSTRQAA
jgi:hypothetical protein